MSCRRVDIFVMLQSCHDVTEMTVFVMLQS